MPITYGDGRHWCDPASETPDASSQWTCPDCGKAWVLHTDGIWYLPDAIPPVLPPRPSEPDVLKEG